MNIYQSFENAIKAEKNAGIAFIYLGGLFLIVSVYLFAFANKNHIFTLCGLPLQMSRLGAIRSLISWFKIRPFVGFET